MNQTDASELSTNQATGMPTAKRTKGVATLNRVYRVIVVNGEDVAMARPTTTPNTAGRIIETTPSRLLRRRGEMMGTTDRQDNRGSPTVVLRLLRKRRPGVAARENHNEWSVAGAGQCSCFIDNVSLMTDEPRLQLWESRVDMPLTAAAVVFLAAYAVPILHPGLPTSALDWMDRTQLVIWGLFALDYLVRLLLADHRRHFIRRNVLDLVVIVVPVLRPLRLLRLVMLLKVMARTAGASLRGRVAVFVGGGTSLVLFLASLAVLEAERPSSDSNIKSFADAVWWSITTMTTVGYGDRYPVTDRGRVVAVGLMLCGIALLGVVTAALASWLVERVQEIEEGSQAATRHDVATLAEEVAQLRRMLADRGLGAVETQTPPRRE